MKTTRRMKRMSRNRVQIAKMNLTSLMDVFTILVFFLLVNSGSAEVLETPKQLVLPESVVEMKPRETVVVFIGTENVVVQGEAVVSVETILASDGGDIVPIMPSASKTFTGVTEAIIIAADNHHSIPARQHSGQIQ